MHAAGTPASQPGSGQNAEPKAPGWAPSWKQPPNCLLFFVERVLLFLNIQGDSKPEDWTGGRKSVRIIAQSMASDGEFVPGFLIRLA